MYAWRYIGVKFTARWLPHSQTLAFMRAQSLPMLAFCSSFVIVQNWYVSCSSIAWVLSICGWVWVGRVWGWG